MTLESQAREYIRKREKMIAPLDLASLTKLLQSVRDAAIDEAATLLEERHDSEFANPHAVDWSLAQAAKQVRALKGASER